MIEIWKEIPGFPGYAVSSEGRVRSPQQILKPFVVKSTGYMQVDLKGKVRKFVHRLVAAAFCEGGGDNVNHKDGVKSNNHPENLEWVTDSQNMLHAYRVLGVIPSGLGRVGAESGRSIPVVSTDPATNKETFYESMNLATRLGYSVSCISKCCRGKQPHHRGLYWRWSDKSLEDLAQFAPREK